MQNQSQPKGLSIGKSALMGTAVAVPIALGAFYLGYSNNQTPVIVQPTNQTQTSNQKPAANQQTAQTETKDLKIKGNKNSHIFHLRGCGSYDRVGENNIVWFKTVEEAVAAGYRMAKNC